MELTQEIKNSIETSVLCWLATTSRDGIPNVSPKEIFDYYGKDNLIIANIASPGSIKNIKENANVCISFIDILKQKGFQLKGKARIIDNTATEFDLINKSLKKMTKGLFPFKTITVIKIDSAKPIIAPRYTLYPDTKELDQIERAKKAYGL